MIKNFSIKEASVLLADAYNGTTSHPTYSATERLAGADALLKELGKDFEANKRDIYRLVEESAKEIVPKRINDSVGAFVELKNFKPGERPVFRIRRSGVKAYVTSAGGSVKRHRIDHQTIMLDYEWIQAHAYEELVRLRAGIVDFKELMDEVIDAIERKVYEIIVLQINTLYSSLPQTNKKSGSTIDEKQFDRIIQIVSSYSQGKPMIVGTFLGLAELPEIDSPEAKNDIYRNGFVGYYKGCPVVELENVVTDISNEDFVLEDRYIYVLPQGAEKVVKVGVGDTIVREKQGEDWTEGMIMATEVGVATLFHENIGAYDVASLAKQD